MGRRESSAGGRYRGTSGVGCTAAERRPSTSTSLEARLRGQDREVHVASKYVLHYGGQQFDVEDDDVLDKVAGDKAVGTIKFRLADRRWLTITTGPGIPIAVEERKQSQPQVPVKVR